jgi:hypothetical protein
MGGIDAGGGMTAGQGGPPDGGQSGPGGGGQQGGPYGPPPGQPPYGQPPYGQPQGHPPYGPPPGAPNGPPFPGYTPAPAATFGRYDGPTPQERPLAVRIGVGAFVGSLVLSVISTVVTLLNWDTISARLLASLRTQQGVDAQTVQQAAQVGIKIGVAVALILAAVYALFAWFAWRGRNWARIVLWVLGGLGVVFGLGGLATGGSPLPFLTGLSFFQVALLAAAIVGLALKPSNEWFRYQRWLRASGQAR